MNRIACCQAEGGRSLWSSYEVDTNFRRSEKGREASYCGSNITQGEGGEGPLRVGQKFLIKTIYCLMDFGSSERNFVGRGQESISTASTTMPSSPRL